MSVVPMFFSFDNRYAATAAVAFESLLSCRAEDDGAFYKLFATEDGLSFENQRKLTTTVLKHQNVSLTFIKLDQNLLDFEFNNQYFYETFGRGFYTKDAMYRCFLSMIPELSEYETIIYSDVDIVFQKNDLPSLMTLDLKNQYLAAIRMFHFLKVAVEKLNSKVMMERFSKDYFLSSFLVMNLKKMREDKLGEKMLSFCKKPLFRIFDDQDLMNWACQGKVYFLEPSYASDPGLFPMIKVKNYQDKHHQYEALYQSVHHPKIIHYGGYKKPWSNLKTARADLWFYYLDKTEFKDAISFETRNKLQKLLGRFKRALNVIFKGEE